MDTGGRQRLQLPVSRERGQRRTTLTLHLDAAPRCHELLKYVLARTAPHAAKASGLGEGVLSNGRRQAAGVCQQVTEWQAQTAIELEA